MGILDAPGYGRTEADSKFATKANIQTSVNDVLASQTLPAAAAANAVTAAMVSNNLSITLVERPVPGDPVASALTVLRGTPTYAAGKFGNAVSGGAVFATPNISDASGDWTVEFWFKHTNLPGGTKCLVWANVAYVGITTTGQLFLNDPAAVAGPNVADGAWHHIAFTFRRVSATSGQVLGLWADGVRVAGAGTSSALTSWTQAFKIGGFTSTGSDVTANGSFDALRISVGTSARYVTDTFTPPTTAPVLDDTTTLLAQLDSTATTQPGAPTGTMGYAARPTSAPNGMVLYVGMTTPTDPKTKDRWIKA